MPIVILDKKIEKQINLLTYPTISRNASLILNSLWNALAGGGTVLGLITLISSTPFTILIGLGIGFILYGFNTAYHFYHDNKNELNLTLKLNHEYDKLKNLIEVNILTQLDRINLCIIFLKLEKKDSYSLHEKQLREKNIINIFIHLQELKEIIKFYQLRIMGMLVKAKENHDDSKAINDLNTELIHTQHQLEIIEKYSKKAQKLYGLNKPIDIQAENLTHCFSYAAVKSASNKTQDSALKNLGNNFTTFLGGASLIGGLSLAVCHLVGIAFSLGFLISNPAGWVILGTMLLGGVTAVVLNHAILKYRRKRIDGLKKTIDKISSFTNVIKHINTSINSIYQYANQHNIFDEPNITKRKIMTEQKIILTENQILEKKIKIKKNQLRSYQRQLKKINEVEANLLSGKSLLPDEAEQSKLSLRSEKGLLTTDNNINNSTKNILLGMEEDQPLPISKNANTKMKMSTACESETSLTEPKHRNKRFVDDKKIKDRQTISTKKQSIDIVTTEGTIGPLPMEIPEDASTAAEILKNMQPENKAEIDTIDDKSLPNTNVPGLFFITDDSVNPWERGNIENNKLAHPNI